MTVLTVLTMQVHGEIAHRVAQAPRAVGGGDVEGVVRAGHLHVHVRVRGVQRRGRTSTSAAAAADPAAAADLVLRLAAHAGAGLVQGEGAGEAQVAPALVQGVEEVTGVLDRHQRVAVAVDDEERGRRVGAGVEAVDGRREVEGVAVAGLRALHDHRLDEGLEGAVVAAVEHVAVVREVVHAVQVDDAWLQVEEVCV